jgi:hypothetical protein
MNDKQLPSECEGRRACVLCPAVTVIARGESQDIHDENMHSRKSQFSVMQGFRYHSPCSPSCHP